MSEEPLQVKVVKHLKQYSPKQLLKFVTEKNNLYYHEVLTEETKNLCIETLEFAYEYDVNFFLMLSNKTSERMLKKYLVSLLPVYHGIPIYANYNNQKLKTLFGYESYNVTQKAEHLSFFHASYFLVARAYIPNKRWFYVCHLPYYDLENSKTSDYFIWSNYTKISEKEEFVKKYYSEMFSSVCSAALNMGLTKIYFPNLGLTYGLQTLNEEEKQLFRTAFLKYFQAALKSYPELEGYLCDEENVHNLPHSNVVNNKTNFFSVKTDYFNFPLDEKSLLISPWNKRSFFGNGGLSNPEIEGRLLSGAVISNTSFLHHWFFQQLILDDLNWITF